MGLILFVALLVLAFVLLGAFVVKWLFILAVVFAHLGHRLLRPRRRGALVPLVS